MTGKHVLLVMICLFSGCSQMTTRVGWPGIEAGLLPVVGFGCVCFLIFLGVTGIVTGEDHVGYAVTGVVIWVVAGLLLQTLPAENGLQFIPVLPWLYTSWLAKAVSVVVWLAIILGSWGMFSSTQKDRSISAEVILVAMAVNGLLSFATPAGAVGPAHRTSNSVKQWDDVERAQRAALDRLLADKGELLGRIRSLGAKDKKDLMANPIGHVLIEELEQLCEQIGKAKRELEMLDVECERARSHRRMIERKTLLEEGKVTTEKYKQLSTSNGDLRAKSETTQTPEFEVRLDAVLDEVFDLKEK